MTIPVGNFRPNLSLSPNEIMLQFINHENDMTLAAANVSFDSPVRITPHVTEVMHDNVSYMLTYDREIKMHVSGTSYDDAMANATFKYGIIHLSELFNGTPFAKQDEILIGANGLPPSNQVVWDWFKRIYKLNFTDADFDIVPTFEGLNIVAKAHNPAYTGLLFLEVDISLNVRIRTRLLDGFEITHITVVVVDPSSQDSYPVKDVIAIPLADSIAMFNHMKGRVDYYRDNKWVKALTPPNQDVWSGGERHSVQITVSDDKQSFQFFRTHTRTDHQRPKMGYVNGYIVTPESTELVKAGRHKTLLDVGSNGGKWEMMGRFMNRKVYTHTDTGLWAQIYLDVADFPNTDWPKFTMRQINLPTAQGGKSVGSLQMANGTVLVHTPKAGYVGTVVRLGWYTNGTYGDELLERVELDGIEWADNIDRAAPNFVSNDRYIVGFSTTRDVYCIDTTTWTFKKTSAADMAAVTGIEFKVWDSIGGIQWLTETELVISGDSNIEGTQYLITIPLRHVTP